MHSGLRSTLAFALLAVGLGLGGCSAGEDQATHPAVTAGKGTKDLFVYGTVKRNGKPVKGARLEVTLTPDAAFDHSKVGERVPVFAAGKATSGSDGSFVLRVDPDDLPTKFFGTARDLLNFALDVEAGADFATWNSTLWAVGNPKVWRTEQEAAPADAAYKLVLDLGTQRIQETDSYGDRTSAGLFVIPRPKGMS